MVLEEEVMFLCSVRANCGLQSINKPPAGLTLGAKLHANDVFVQSHITHHRLPIPYAFALATSTHPIPIPKPLLVRKPSPNPQPTMRLTPRLLATPSSIGAQSSGLRPVPLALLPPIPLYRRLLRGHRKHLPKEMRLLGDEYVKSEFRAHRETENPVHIVRFFFLFVELFLGGGKRGDKAREWVR